MAAVFGGSGANGATPWGDTGYTGPYVTNQQTMSILGQNYSAPNNDPISFSDPGQVFPTLPYGGASGVDIVNTKPLPLGNGAVFGGTSTGAPGGSGGGMPSASPAGSISGATAGQNPYLQHMGDALVQQNTQNLQRNVLPRIGSAAMAAGGYGGSRQGVVESNAISDLNTANANGLASLYGGAYNTNLQYDLGRRNNDLGYFGAANSYNLGMGNLGLGYAGLDRQIANDNMSWGQQGYNNNMGLWNQQMNNNQIGLGAGQGIQNTPMNYWQQFGNQYNSIGQGYGTQTSSGGGGNPIMGALGGAQLGSQVANWWNGGGSGTGMTGSNAPASSYNIGSFDYGIGGGGGGGLGLRF